MNKLVCELCQKEVIDLNSLSKHLAFSHKNISHKAYYIFFIDPNYKCEFCGDHKKFRSVGLGYRNTCCKQSCIKNNKKKVTRLKYGVDHISQLDWVKNKKIETCLNNNGVSNPMKNTAIKEKHKNKILSLYNVDNISKSPEVKEKRKKTCLYRYKANSPVESPIIKKKIDESNLNRWKTIVPAQNTEVRKKMRAGSLKNIGVNTPFESKTIREKANKKLLKTHGVTNPMKKKEFRLKQQLSTLDRYSVNNIFKSKDFIAENKKRSFDRFYNLLNTSSRLKNLVTPLFTKEDYNGSKDTKYKFKCIKCEKIFYDYVKNGRVPRCLNCYPISGSSLPEKGIQEWLTNYGLMVENNVRHYYNDNLNFYELDIYLKDYNIGIELDGVYWHSERSGKKSKRYHLDKTEFFKDKGINIIHIWDIEWIEKKDIIKSIILSKLGIYENRLYARKCSIKEVTSLETNTFLDSNHLQGNVGASIKLGLYFDGQLSQVMTFSKSRFNTKYEYELIRFCTKINHQVVGGFSKLLSYFKNNFSGSLISYCDRRFSTKESIYNKYMNFERYSNPNYFYTKDYKLLESRIKYQKHKLSNILEKYDSSLTEWENMQVNSYDRVWDCGNSIFTLKT